MEPYQIKQSEQSTSQWHCHIVTNCHISVLIQINACETVLFEIFFETRDCRIFCNTLYIHDFYEPLPYILLQNTLKIKNWIVKASRVTIVGPDLLRLPLSLFNYIPNIFNQSNNKPKIQSWLVKASGPTNVSLYIL